MELTIQGRDCEVRVAEVADNCPVLIGFIPLELLISSSIRRIYA
jgi:hypothetical protein